jgi:DNA polymerase III epsilon subunit-like protein
MSTYKQKKLPQWGFAIDWETSGSAWGRDSTIDYQGVSFGAVVFTLDTFEPVDSIYREIKFDASKYKWSIEAERIHGLSREHLEKNGVSSEDAAVALMEMFVKYFAPDEYIYILGHHIDFDIKFTKQLLEPFGIMFNIGATQIDTAGTGLIMFGIHKSEDLFQFLGLPPRTTHNALEDAMLTIQAAKMMRLISNSALQV